MEDRHRRKERIVHLTTVHNVRDPRISRKQLTSLKAAGYEVCLVAPAKDSGVINGIPVLALPPIEGRYQRVKLQKKAYQAARDLNASLYHFHDPELIPLAYLLKRATGAAVIYDMHEDYRWHGPIEGRIIRMLERWCFQWVDHVVVANAAHTDITERFGVASTRIANHHKPTGGENKPLIKLDLASPERLRLIYTGVISDKGGRGLFSLLRLAQSIKDRKLDWQLALVGICYSSDLRNRAEKRIQDQQLDELIQRVGWDTYVDWSDIVKHLQHADVGLFLGTNHPNQIQKIPTKFYEYLHFGLPILCSDFPRWRRFIERHNCGAVVPPGDTETAVHVLKRWKSCPNEYQALSSAAREASKQYRWKEMGYRLVRLYDELLA
jgi:glycosyltransferase involved in cell wall biosynthesis